MCCVGSWFHIWDTSRTVGGIGHWRWGNDRRSERNLCNCVKKPEKKYIFRTSTGFEPVISKESIEHCYRTLLRNPGLNDEANSHAQSTWRLHTPTICGRSVPAQCNAGLPKKKTLQQGKINRKTIQIVLVSTMPPRLSILSCYIPVAHGRLSMTREVFTWIPFRDTRIKVRWASTCVPNIRPNSILVNTLQATNSSKIIYIGLFGACLRSSNDETAWTIGLEDFPLTYDL